MPEPSNGSSDPNGRTGCSRTTFTMFSASVLRSSGSYGAGVFVAAGFSSFSRLWVGFVIGVASLALRGCLFPDIQPVSQEQRSQSAACSPSTNQKTQTRQGTFVAVHSPG